MVVGFQSRAFPDRDNMARGRIVTDMVEVRVGFS